MKKILMNRDPKNHKKPLFIGPPCILQRRAYNKFKRNYLENYNDSEDAVKTKNASFFMIFPNISFFHMIVTDWTGPLMEYISLGKTVFDEFFSE